MKIRLLFLTLFLTAAASLAMGQRSGIRSVDLRNFDYGPLCAGRHQFLTVPSKRLVLKYGHASHGDAMNYADLGPVRYVDLDGDGREEAFTVINGQTGGSSNTYLAAYVFSYENRRARQLWTKCEENSAAMLDGRNVVFKSPSWAKGEAHCCFSHVNRDTYALRGGKVVLLSTKRSLNLADAPGHKDPEQLATELAKAFAAADLGRLDKEKPYSGLVTVELAHSLRGRMQRKGFSSLKLANQWLKKGRPEVNFAERELDKCAKGLCTYKDLGLLHNNLYLQSFEYVLVKGRPHIKRIDILDGD
jgi:hypothetical protein